MTDRTTPNDSSAAIRRQSTAGRSARKSIGFRLVWLPLLLVFSIAILIGAIRLFLIQLPVYGILNRAKNERS